MAVNVYLDRGTLVKKASTGIIAKLEAKRDMENVIYHNLDRVTKAERVLAGGCKVCFQFDNTHIFGCSKIKRGGQYTLINVDKAT